MGQPIPACRRPQHRRVVDIGTYEVEFGERA